MSDRPVSSLSTAPGVSASDRQAATTPSATEDTGPVVTFADATITVQTVTVPAWTVTVVEGDTDRSMQVNADVQPLSIARVADYVIINFGGGRQEKHLLRALEAAMVNGSLIPTSTLGKA